MKPLPMKSEISTAAFAASLPAEYSERFNPAQIAVHAHASVRRRNGDLVVAAFPWNQSGISGICVVADDRPGLLSQISAALSELGFDVDSAAAFTRTASPPEAVDVFWVRDEKGALDEGQVASLSDLLKEILSGRELRPRMRGPETSTSSGAEGTTVRFLEDENGALDVLEVETDDCSGLLWAITRALFEAKVQIISSQVNTQGARVKDRFAVVELSGAPVSSERRLAIQIAVLSALQ